MNVAILGASNKPDRYSYKALVKLREAGHTVYPVHPALKEIEGLAVYANLREIPQTIDTLTLYVGPQRSSSMAEDIFSLKPGRVIFNPGAENTELKTRLQAEGIECVEACTLVMLATNRF